MFSNTELGSFCSQHDNWRDLLTEEPYCLKIKEDKEYIIFNYSLINSDFHNNIVREARGIIFKKDCWEYPVCWAFNKFGNYGESYVPEIDWSSAFVTEKIDGTLIKVWYDISWHISTSSSIDAYDARMGDYKVADFGTYFTRTVRTYYKSFKSFTGKLNKDLTYMFELVGPYNRIVIPCNVPMIYFLGARNKFNGDEFYPTTNTRKGLGVDRFRYPESFAIDTLKKCLDVTQKLPWNREGFVVVDDRGNRIKVKSPAYILAHYKRNNNVITKKHLIRIILMNEVEEFLCYASDYKEELLKIKDLMDLYHTTGNKLVAQVRNLPKVTRPEYTTIVKTFPILYQRLLFRNYDSPEPVKSEDLTLLWDEHKWEVCLEELEKLDINNKGVI